jgi:ribosomal protein S20
VTGFNISMQKDEYFTLHTGLKYYYNTDKRIFEQIKRRYHQIWFKSNFETQIKEIAHNIRNTNSNLRIKQKDLPTTTNKHIKPIRNINNQQMKLINTDAQYDYYID